MSSKHKQSGTDLVLSNESGSSDSGRYRCTARNRLGRDSSYSVVTFLGELILSFKSGRHASTIYRFLLVLSRIFHTVNSDVKNLRVNTLLKFLKKSKIELLIISTIVINTLPPTSLAPITLQ